MVITNSRGGGLKLGLAVMEEPSIDIAEAHAKLSEGGDVWRYIIRTIANFANIIFCQLRPNMVLIGRIILSTIKKSTLQTFAAAVV